MAGSGGRKESGGKGWRLAAEILSRLIPVHKPSLIQDQHAARALSLALAARDPETAEHSLRVQSLVHCMLQAGRFSRAERTVLSMASLLHDVGKLGVPEHILTKPGQLTPHEANIMRTHAAEGADILEKCGFSKPVTTVVRAHHERWDGAGYPDALRMTEIPSGARILGVADTFDALCSHRRYRRAWTPGQAMDLLERESGTAFDPRAVALFRECLPKIAYPAATARHTAHPTSRTASPEELLAFSQWAGWLAETVPHSALVVWKTEQESLVCRYATGMHAAALETVSLRVGDGISGWVASSGQDLINGDPTLEGAAAFSDFRSVLSLPVGQMGVLSLYSGIQKAFLPEHVGKVRAECARVADLLEMPPGAAAEPGVSTSPALQPKLSFDAAEPSF